MKTQVDLPQPYGTSHGFRGAEDSQEIAALHTFSHTFDRLANTDSHQSAIAPSADLRPVSRIGLASSLSPSSLSSLAVVDAALRPQLNPICNSAHISSS